MVTPEAKPKAQNPKTQISNLMLQWNYEPKKFETRTTKHLPDLNAMVTPETKPKIQKPHTQISNLMLQWNYEHKTFSRP